MKKFNSVQEELIYIAERHNGLLNPSDVVRFAQDQGTKLHSRFEWDDSEAGHKYRLWQARQVISLEFQVMESGEKNIGPVRTFVSLRDDRISKNGYRLMLDVMSNESLRDKMLSEALSELVQIKTKYKKLTELNSVFEAIDNVEISRKKKVA
jgi:hypothetical protein